MTATGMPLDYASPDPAALAPGEIVLHEAETIATGGGCLGAIGFVAVVAAVFAIFAGAASFLLPVGTGGVVIVTGLVVALSVALLGGNDRFGRRGRTSTTRMTDRRLICHTAAATTQSWYADVYEIATRRDRAPRSGAEANATLGVGMPEDEDGCADDDLTVGAMTFERAGRLADTVGDLALAARGTRRVRRRAWRPLTVEVGVTSDEWTLADGEQLLWTGRPVLRAAADARARARAIARSSPWILTAIAAILLPALGDARRNVGLLALAGVGLLILWGQAHAHVVEPLGRRRRLRRTEYALTDRRVLVRVTAGRHVTERTHFFDDETTVGVDVSRDGRGTVTFGIADLLESVAGARIAEPIPVANVRPVEAS